ncbi:MULTISPECIES: pilus assembly protein [unclassified Arsukibacterium]|uniref:pilus assembly protein n=1 Tax=unclassified Arsukibacterium TaxID=2635278 RepID=UPI000C450857|nr:MULTISPECIES: PilC/PilY family type IV pilus protein [unclassified Arsukibacterium]MBM34427.1 pilus assembly protein PilY [Rheinheimera sp.]|tara:strand:+ start:32268 stop:35411 length:3144 start_codon:yes stop_codon:yes gene_type:complete
MSKYNTVSKNAWLMFSMGMLMGLSSAHAATTLSIPQVPLQTGSDVPPNILFMLDDSGSMAWSYMPDSISGICRNSTDVEDRAMGRSPHINKAYFDPAVNYVAPLQANGTPFANASFTAARTNGYSSSSAIVNLKTSFRATWQYQDGGSDAFCGSAGAADYYLYEPALCDDDDDEDDEECYRRYIVDEQSDAIKQNFANWYSYYRSRLMLSKAGIGRAFQTLPERMRVGYGRLNRNPEVERGVRAFEGSNKNQFYTWLYGRPDTTSGTPLKSTLQAAGDYYKTAEPYRAEPENTSSGLVSCRQNFTVLMTDGFYTNQSRGFGDSDGDGDGDTLADIAHHYWKTDLRSDLENNVPSGTLDPANWQHMVTYGVGLGVDGTITNVDDAKKWPINDSRWPKPDSNPRKIDDLLHAGVNSRGGFFSARDPETFNTELTNTLRNIVNRVASASNLAATTTTLQEDNSVFQASFNTSTWSGELVGVDVEDFSVQWTANFPDWGDRVIETSRGSGANPAQFSFEWAELNSAEKTALDNEQTVNYLRGERVNELTLFRERASLLGDIAHSSPVYVAESQNRNYQRYSWPEASSYQSFLTTTKTRAPRIFVGANDGMLHSFNADATVSDAGEETFAYVPQAMLTETSRLTDFASIDYEHRFYVDGSPIVADVFIGGAWRTVLVGTLGRGGDWMFALDITDPSEIKVLWDIKVPELGIMPHKPVITRLNNGRWSVLVGYGYNNSPGKSGLLVVDLEQGASLPIRKLETSDSDAVGLAQVEGWDQNKNGNTDWVFAADINGNVWKFDLSSTSASSWQVAYGGAPLFVAKDTAGKRQPITGGVTLQSHPDNAELWVFFGTGKFIETGDSVNADTQSWYGIKDGERISSRSELVSRTMTNVDYTNPDTGEVRSARSLPYVEGNDMDGKRGWVMDLVDTRERITSKPRFISGNLVMNTIIPDTDLCNPQGDGWIMAVDPFKGSRLNYHFFDLSGDEKFEGADGLPDGAAASGVKFDGMPGEPVFFTEGDKSTMITPDSTVGLNNTPVNVGILRGRLSWRELIN